MGINADCGVPGVMDDNYTPPASGKGHTGRVASDSTEAPVPPCELGERGLVWWNITCSEWSFEPHELELLAQAACCLDRIDQASADIAEHTLFMTDRYGVRKESPAVKIERSSRAQFDRLVKSLDMKAAEAKRPAHRPVGSGLN